MKSIKTKDIRRPLILLIDDMPENIQLLASLLSREGYNCAPALTGKEGLERIYTLNPDLVLLDLIMPQMDGMEVLRSLSCEMPQIPVVVVTAETNPQTAAECLRLGAKDYITKPIDPLRLCTVVKNVLRAHYISSLEEPAPLTQLKAPEFTEFVYESTIMQNLLQEAILVASDPAASILITGQEGTGKTLLSTLIARHRGITFSLDCSAVIDWSTIKPPPETQPLHLDNIGVVGTDRHRRLLKRVQAGTGCVMTCGAEMENLLCTDDFWKELYFCSPCRHFHLPLLKERTEDIPVLFEHFLHLAAHEKKTDLPEITLEAIMRLKTLNYPGNLNDLKRLAEEVAVCSKEHITADDINHHCCAG